VSEIADLLINATEFGYTFTITSEGVSFAGDFGTTGIGATSGSGGGASQNGEADRPVSPASLGPPPDLDWDNPSAVERYHAARDLILKMEQLPKLVSGFESALSLAEAAAAGGPLTRAAGAVLAGAVGSYYSIQITDNVIYQNALRPRFGLPRITYPEALKLGGIGPGKDLSRLRAEQAHVRREAGLVVRW
jgi:hypothetical protein